MYTKTVRILNIKYLRCYFTKLLGCYQRDKKFLVKTRRQSKECHCFPIHLDPSLLVFSVFHFKVQMVSAMAGIGVALGDVVLHRRQGK